MSVDPADEPLWNERFPKVVTGPDWYFHLPLKIEMMNAQKDVSNRHVYVNFGACSEGTLCKRLDLDVKLPVRAQGRQTTLSCEE